MVTKADKQLILKYDELDEQFEDTHGADIFNHMRSTPCYRELRDKIIQGMDVTREELQKARLYFQNRIDFARKMAEWPEPAVYKIAKARGKVDIDGKLDEPAWEYANTAPIRYGVNDPEPMATPMAYARMLWDEEYLYAGFEVPDEDIQAPELDRDGPTYLYDCVEVFVMGNPRFKMYWELNVSPSGSVFDLLGFWHPREWGSEYRKEENIEGLLHAAEVSGPINDPSQKNDGYSIELAIPWKEIPNTNGAPCCGAILSGLMAISALDIVDGERRHVFVSHSPTLGSFHNIKTYTPLELVE